MKSDQSKTKAELIQELETLRNRASVQDIPEHKWAEEELREQMRRNEQILRTTMDGYILADTEGQLIEVNPAYCKMVGYSQEELLKLNIRQLEVKLVPDEIERRIAQLVSQGRDRFETKHKSKDGRVIDLDVSIVIMQPEEAPLVAAFVRDITERKRADEVLGESEKRYRLLFENLLNGFALHEIVLDKKGKPVDYIFLEVNEAFEQFTGLRRKNIIGKKVTEVLPGIENDPADWISRYGKVALGGGEIRFEQYAQPLEKWYSVIAFSPRKNQFAAVFEETTERKKARLALEEALKKAQEGERVKTFFLANMSHEIRTPLNAILGFTDLIERSARYRVGEEERGFFDTIHSSGERLLRTVHEVLDMSQIEADAFSPELKELNLVEMVKQVTAVLLPQAEDKGLMLSFTSDLSQGLIKGDEYCVTQSLTNIVDNAIKYTEKGSIDIVLTDSDGQLILSIKDTGIGVSEEYLDEIFEVFTQESTGYTKRFQGVGLGLALTKRYLELCKATIAVESEKGVGTTFTLTFQKAKKAKAKKAGKPEATAPEAPAPEPEKKPLLLLVEDDVSSQKLLSFYLKKHYDSYTAVSVGEAKRVLKSEPVKLIILDLSLIGDEDGLDLARYLRNSKRWKDIPIIVTTAHVFDTDRERCLAAGCNDYLAKPIKQIDLLEKIKQYL